MNFKGFFILTLTIVLFPEKEPAMAYLNSVSDKYNIINSSLTVRGISGTLLTDNSITDFVGVNFLGLNQEGQPGIINGMPVAWINDGRSWRSIFLTEVSLITYNKFENLKGRCMISLTVSLKDGNSYDYKISPAKSNMIILVKTGSDNTIEKSIEVFNSEELVLSGILFD